MSLQIISMVTDLPQIGDHFFPNLSSRVMDLKPHKKQFLQWGESVENVQGQGMVQKSIPSSWDVVAKFLINYITCEGCYKHMFVHHFCLMLHLHYSVLVNLSYYLFCSLKWSPNQYNQGHLDSLACHGLIKLAQPILEWDAFVNQTNTNNPKLPTADNTLKASPSKK